MASKIDLIRAALLSLPALLDGSKELVQGLKKAKIDDEELKAALSDLLDQKKEIEELRLVVESLKTQNRLFFWVTTILLATLIATVLLFL